MALLPAGLQAQTRELSSAGDLLDGIAAIVNDGIVLKSELQVELEQITARLKEQGTALPPPQALAQQVLERLVIRRIQLQRAERLGIQVSDETLNQALATVAQRNDTSLTELPARLAAEGVDYSQYRREVREQIMVDQLRQRDVIQRIGITPREVDAYLARQEGKVNLRQEYLVSHILVAVPAAATPDDITKARERAEDLQRRAQSGESFAQLAVAYSAGQQALEGGQLGWLKGSELPSVFADVVPALNPGEVGGPVRNSSGFHLIRLDDRRGTEAVMEDQTRARHILIKPTEVMDDDAVRQRLLDIRRRILAGEDFAAVAKAISEDPQSAVEGGDLGWAGPGTFVPEFEQVVAGLGVDEISEPFRTQFGWHIIQLQERRVHDATADKQRQEAMLAIRNSKLGEETELWTRRLRDEAFVEYRL